MKQFQKNKKEIIREFNKDKYLKYINKYHRIKKNNTHSSLDSTSWWGTNVKSTN